MKKPNTEDFEQKLGELLEEAQKHNKLALIITSGDLHRLLGGYPTHSHRMKTACKVMKKMMKAGDEILYEPPKGHGATVKVKYYLPR